MRIIFIISIEEFMKKTILLLLSLMLLPCAKAEIDEKLYKKYEDVTNDINLIQAIEKLSETTGKYSKDAILGKNLTNKPIKIEFMNLSTINPMYTNLF